MAPGTVHRLAEFAARADVTPEAKLLRLAREVDALEVLARVNATAQRTTGDAVQAMAEALVALCATLAEQKVRLESIEAGVLEAIDIASRADGRARDAMASDLDLTQTVERERLARDVEAARVREMLAPIVADVGRKAGNAGATKTAGALSVAAVVAGLAAKPAETIALLREIGPTGAGIAVLLLLVVLVFARFRRS